MVSKPESKTTSTSAKRPQPRGQASRATIPAKKSTSKTVDLAKLFGTVAKTLSQNQTSLNTADTYNHDHGDHMVETFEVITQAMKEKKTATPAEQLAYASKLLQAKSQSGSAKLYVEGLSDAAAQFKGSKAITTDTAMTLIQTLLGAKGSVPTSAVPTQGGGSGDLLGSLIGGLAGGQQSQGGGAGDLLGSLIGGLAGGQQPQAENTAGGDGKIDIGDLLNAGMAFAQTKQSGGSNLDAILNAVVSSSKMSGSDHRTQSGALVANTLMQFVGQMAGKK